MRKKSPVSDEDNLTYKGMCEDKHPHCRYSGNTYWTIQNSWGDDWADHGYANYGPRDHDALNLEYASFYANVKKVTLAGL